MRILFIGLAVAAATLLGGCRHPAAETVQGPITVVWPVYEAEGPVWVLYHLNGKPVDVSTSPAGLRFHGPTQHVYGTSGVNTFSGEYRMESSGLHLKPLEATKRAGPPERMELEREFLAALGRVTTWRIQEGVLVLLEGPKPVAYLVRQPEPPAKK